MSAAAPSSRNAWSHAGALAVAVVVIGVLFPTGAWRSAAEVALFAWSLTAVAAALRRHRTTGAIAWWGLGGCMAFFGLSSAIEVPLLLGTAPGVLRGWETAFDLAAYGSVVVAALAHLVGGRRRHDREAWIDTGSLLLAGGLAVLAFVDGADAGAGSSVTLGVGLAMITAIVLLVCVPLATAGQSRSVSTSALLVAGGCTVLGFGGQIATPWSGDRGLFDEILLLALAAIALAGRHPSVATFGHRSATGATTASGRVVGLGSALLVSPALLFLWAMRHGPVGYVLGVGSSLLTAVALWRLAGLTRERERARAALAAGESRLRLLLANATDVIAMVDVTGTITYMSPASERLLGLPGSAYVGRPAIGLADPRDQPRLHAAVAAAGSAGTALPGFVDADVRVQHSDGSSRWVEVRISGRVTEAGLDGWVVNVREVTDRKLFEEELRRQATTDPLTGLLNRTAFNERLAVAAAGAGPGSCPAVLFVDVDDFKDVNDTLGHAAGDELLLAVAGRLSADVRGEDVVARLGGDEFALLLADADATRLREVAERLLTALRAPVRVGRRTTTVTASIGGALGTPGCTAEELLHRADTAMYAAKRTGKDSCALLGVAEDALP